MELKNNALFKENCLIGGKWIESDSGEQIDVDNPANGEIIGGAGKFANVTGHYYYKTKWLYQNKNGNSDIKRHYLEIRRNKTKQVRSIQVLTETA